MTEFWNTKNVKIRKAHTCEGCLTEKQPGEEMEYNLGKWEGEMHSYYFCLECREFITKNDWAGDQLQEGFSAGDIGEWRREEEKEAASR